MSVRVRPIIFRNMLVFSVAWRATSSGVMSSRIIRSIMGWKKLSTISPKSGMIGWFTPYFVALSAFSRCWGS